jgi:integrase
MRHTGVTLMLKAGINPRVIQLLAGWTSLRMLERYGHARDSEIRRAVMANPNHWEQAATKTATEGETATGSSEP